MSGAGPGAPGGPGGPSLLGEADPGPLLTRRRALAAIGAFALGLAVDGVWARLVRGWRLERAEYPKMRVGPYRVHHNVVGWAALAVGVFVLPWALVPFGVGMIVGHRLRDRLWWFLERTR